MAQQTAVEWVVFQMLENGSHRIWPSLLEKAKQLEKEQIIEAYCNGNDLIGAEQYYNEKYSKQA